MKSNLKQNLLYQSFYEIIIIILPLITSPYISRVLGAENLGIFSYTYSIAYYFQLFGMLGIKFYGNRKIAQVRDNPSELNQTFSELLTVHILTSLISCCFYIFYILFFVVDNKAYSIIQGLMVIATVFDVSWFFFGIENFKLNVIRNTIIRIFSVLCIFLFVKEKNDLWKYTTIMATSQALGESILFAQTSQYVKYHFPKFCDLKKHIKPLLVLFVPVISTSLFKYMSKIMLGTMGNKIELGLYDNAEKILNVPLSVILAFGSVMLPKMSNLVIKNDVKQSNRYMKLSIKYMLGISIAMFFGMSGIARVFAPVFWGKEFAKCADLIMILSLSLPFTTIANIVRNQDLIPNNKDRHYTLSIIIGAIVNLTINWLLIPKYQAYGVSIGTVSAEITVCILQFFAVRKDFNYKQYIINSMWFLIPGMTMYLFVVIIGKFLGAHLYTLVIQLFVGIVIFGILSLLLLIKFEDEYVVNMISKIKKDGK